MALQARNVVTRDHLARKSGAEPTQELLQAHETDPKQGGGTLEELLETCSVRDELLRSRHIVVPWMRM